MNCPRWSAAGIPHYNRASGLVEGGCQPPKNIAQYLLLGYILLATNLCRITRYKVCLLRCHQREPETETGRGKDKEFDLDWGSVQVSVLVEPDMVVFAQVEPVLVVPGV